MRQISNSEIQTFKRCRRKWWLGFYRRLSRIDPQVSRPRDIGDLVHRRLDSYYSGGMEDDVLALLVQDQLEMKEAFPESQHEEIDQVVEFARIMLEGYFEWVEETGADANLEVIGPERSIRVALPKVEGVELMGKIDLQVYDHDRQSRAFLETKTVSNFGDKESLAHMNEQIYTYHLLERLELLEQDIQTRTDGAVLNMLRRVKRTASAKPPFYKRMPIWHNDDELRAFFVRTIGVVKDILSVESLLDAGANPLEICYPTIDRSCTYMCEFFTVCPMVDDNRTDAEGYIAVSFRESDPYARYKDDDSD